MGRTNKTVICLALVILIIWGFALSAGSAAPTGDGIRKAIYYYWLFSEKYRNGGEDEEAQAPAAGEREGDILVVHVSENGSDTSGNGTLEAPFATLQGALAKLRETSREGFAGVTVRLSDGVYRITEPIAVDDGDSSAACPLTIEGSGDSLICGGVYLESGDFTPASGETAELFPDEVRDSIVMIDLKQFGYTPEKIASMKSSRNYLLKAVMLSKNGSLQTLCRYPDGDWSFIPEGWMLDQYGDVTTVTDNGSDPEHEAKKYVIRYDSELEDHVRSWSMSDTVFVAARMNQLWCTDNTYVLGFDPDDTLMILPYTGGYNPVPGGIFYWYNVPEELDAPGEYYVSDDAVLYYLPGDDFETSSFTLPVSEGLMDIQADCVTLRNIRFDASAESGITAQGNGITVEGCEISTVRGDHALRCKGNGITVAGCEIHDVAQTAIDIDSGDLINLVKGDSVVYNNRIYRFGINNWPYTMGVNLDGAGITVSHNEIYDSKTRGIYWDGAYMTIEFNNVHDVLTASDDIGAISCDNRDHACNVIRYNYIHRIGCTGVLKDINARFPDYRYMGCAAVYGDFSGSYYECYGNVIETVNGGGFYGYGRCISIHDNLIIDCSGWYVILNSYEYEDYYNLGKGGSIGLPGHVRNEAWAEANPDLAGLVTDLSQVESTDPRGYAMPAGIEVRNNWIHFNKFIRDFTNWGIAPYSIGKAIYAFSGDSIDVPENSHSNRNVSVYNSRRETYTIEELLEKAKDVIDLNYGTFIQMGTVTD